MIHDLSRQKVCVEDGTIAVPDAPGLGLEIDDDVISRFATD
jgi:L-alanine-DL-glutamate epimerase-like enolase superfamily enzyme